MTYWHTVQSGIMSSNEQVSLVGIIGVNAYHVGLCVTVSWVILEFADVCAIEV